MRMPQVEKKLAPGKLWTKEGEPGKDETCDNSWAQFPWILKRVSLGPLETGSPVVRCGNQPGDGEEPWKGRASEGHRVKKTGLPPLKHP